MGVIRARPVSPDGERIGVSLEDDDEPPHKIRRPDAAWNEMMTREYHKKHEESPAQIVLNSSNLTIYEIRKRRTLIGRKSRLITPDIDLKRIFPESESKGVSHEHAVITWSDKSRTFSMKVIGSNGVVLNGVRQPSGSEFQLLHGSHIIVGPLKIEFLIPKFLLAPK